MNKYNSDLSNQFKGKNIIVTGSTQGIGAETAKLLPQEELIQLLFVEGKKKKELK